MNLHRVDPRPALALALILGLTGCQAFGRRPMAPSPAAGLSVEGAGIKARVDRVHAAYFRAGGYLVDVELTNQDERPLQIAPDKPELVELGGAQSEQPNTFLQVATYPIAGYTVIEGERRVAKGARAALRLDLGAAPIDTGKPYALRLERAIGAQPGALPPLLLVRPSMPHLGYGAPEETRWVIVGRLGGGGIRVAPILAGLGGVEIFVGPQFGRFSFGLQAMIGAGSVGGEARLRLDPTEFISIIPFAGYGYYHTVGFLGFGAGHGPRGGVEVQFASSRVMRMGWTRSSGRVGFYVHAGPVFLTRVDAIGTAVQGGLAFGYY